MIGGVPLGWLVEKVADEASTRIVEGAIKRVLRKRAEAARDIAIEEIAAGRGHVVLDAPAQDEAVAILWRYLRAAEEGAACINLRLMASILAGNSGASPVYASEFLRWADLTASLSEEEILLLAVPHREGSDEVARQCLIPRIFLDDGDYELTARALLRTGLIVQTALVVSDGPEGRMGMYFETSHRMAKLAALADLEGVLRRGGAA